jgi:hypothetical protein
VHAGSAERAAVTATVLENAPGIGEIVAILPDGFGDVFVSVGVLFVQPVGDQADPVFVIFVIGVRVRAVVGHGRSPRPFISYYDVFVFLFVTIVKRERL